MRGSVLSALALCGLLVLTGNLPARQQSAGAGTGAPPPDSSLELSADSLATLWAEPVRSAEDTAAAAVDSVRTEKILPDTVWAVPLTSVTTLDSALALHERLLEHGVDSFARIRADSTRYWYEIFAGPAAAKAEVESLSILVHEIGLAQPASPIKVRGAELLRGIVTEPLATTSAATVARQSGASEAVSPAVPQLIQFVEPEYHEVARNARLAGTVVVNVLVGKNGEVLETEILQPVHLLLDDAANRAARQCLYAPAREDGQPVEAWLAVPFEFELD